MRKIFLCTLILLFVGGVERAGADASADHPLNQSIYSEELIGGDLAVSALGLYGSGSPNCSGNFDLTGEIADPAHTTIDAAFVVLISRTIASGLLDVTLTFDGSSAGTQDYQFADVHTSGYYKTHIWDVSAAVTDPDYDGLQLLVQPLRLFYPHLRNRSHCRCIGHR